MKKLLLIATMALMSVAGFAQTKFAHVNFNELVQLMPETDEARATMNAASAEAQETYQAMVEEFNTKYQQYQQKVSTWTATIRETKERELTEIQARIEEFNASVQQELSLQQNDLMAPIYAKAQEVVQNLAKAGGYAFVLDASTFLYVDPTQSKDLTEEARVALNIPADRTMESLQAELMAEAEAAAAIQ